MRFIYKVSALVGLPAFFFSYWYGFFWVFGYFGPATMAEAHKAGIVIGASGAVLGLLIGIGHMSRYISEERGDMG